MMRRFSVVLVLSTALGGCVVPQTGPGPENVPVSRPAPRPDTGPDAVHVARRACMVEARREGLNVRAFEEVAFLGGDRYRVWMRSRGQYGPERISCVYNGGFGVARLEGKPEAERDPFVLARHACITEAKKQGREVVGVGKTTDLGGQRYQVVLRVKGPRGPVPLTCIYNATFRAVRIP